MNVSLLIIIIVALAFGYYIFVLQDEEVIPSNTQLVGLVEDISFCKDISEKYYLRIQTHIKAFLKKYQLSFDKEKCTEDLYKSLFTSRTKVANAFMELKTLIPNDLELESKLETSNKNIAYILKVFIEDVRVRCKFPNYVQEPFHDYYYGKHVSAVNDVLT